MSDSSATGFPKSSNLDSINNIVQQKDPVLRKKAEPVKLSMLGTPEMEKIYKDMAAAMATQRDGVAIAAPQIGVSLQIFMVSGEVLAKADKNYTGDTSNLIFINPKLSKLSREKELLEEGCLSVRWLYGKVPRSVRASILAINEKAKRLIVAHLASSLKYFSTKQTTSTAHSSSTKQKKFGK